MSQRFGIRVTLNTGSKTCPGSYAWFTKFDKTLSEWSMDPADAQTWPTKEDAKWYLATHHLSGRIVEIR